MQRHLPQNGQRALNLKAPGKICAREDARPPSKAGWMLDPGCSAANHVSRFTFHGRNVPSALARRAFPTAQRVSKISPTSPALARAKRLAISAAVTGSFTVASAALSALTRSDSVFGQASLPPRCSPGFDSGSTSTARTASQHSMFLNFFSTDSAGIAWPRVGNWHCRWPIQRTSSGITAAHELISSARSFGYPLYSGDGIPRQKV